MNEEERHERAGGGDNKKKRLEVRKGLDCLEKSERPCVTKVLISWPRMFVGHEGKEADLGQGGNVAVRNIQKYFKLP